MTKIQKKGVRGKRGQGHLYKRDHNGKSYPPNSKVPGTYWLRLTIDGVRSSFPLTDEHGRAIRTKSEAEDARLRLVAPYLAKNKVQKIQTMVRELSQANADLAIAEDDASPGILVAHAWEHFTSSPERPDASGKTIEQYSYQFQRFVDWMQAEHPDKPKIQDISRAVAADYARSLMASGLSPNTYNKYLNLLALIWRVLGSSANVSDNPWLSIKRRKLTTANRRELTVEELKSICASLEGEMRVLFALGIYSGLRLGDAVLLDWGEVDIVRNKILKVTRKTGRRVNIEMHPVLLAMIVETPKSKRRGYVMPELAKLYRQDRSRVTRQVQQCFIDAGIETTEPADEGRQRVVVRVGFHSLRHTFVSLLAERKVPLAVVQSLVGHGNPAMTRHYTHVGELAMQSAIASLPAIADAEPTPDPTRDRLPQWASELVANMNAKNWKSVREELQQGNIDQ